MEFWNIHAHLYEISSATWRKPIEQNEVVGGGAQKRGIKESLPPELPRQGIMFHNCFLAVVVLKCRFILGVCDRIQLDDSNGEGDNRLGRRYCHPLLVSSTMYHGVSFVP